MLSSTTPGAEPVGLKFRPEIVIWPVDGVTTVLLMTGAPAAQHVASANNPMDKSAQSALKSLAVILILS
jgi:hypothetical protein